MCFRLSSGIERECHKGVSEFSSCATCPVPSPVHMSCRKRNPWLRRNICGTAGPFAPDSGFAKHLGFDSSSCFQRSHTHRGSTPGCVPKILLRSDLMQSDPIPTRRHTIAKISRSPVFSELKAESPLLSAVTHFRRRESSEPRRKLTVPVISLGSQSRPISACGPDSRGAQLGGSRHLQIYVRA